VNLESPTEITLFPKETVTVNESKDDSDVLVEDEKKPKGC